MGAVALEKFLPSDIATQPGLSLISSFSGIAQGEPRELAPWVSRDYGAG